MPGVPTDADALAGLPPPRDVLAHGVDHTDHLVPRDAREGDAGPLALLGKDVAVADAAGLNLDPHGPWSRVGDRALDELEGPAGARDLGDTHRGHEDSPRAPVVLRSRRDYCLFGRGMVSCLARALEGE